MKESGATVIDPVAIPDLEKYNNETALYLTQSKHDIDKFIKRNSNRSIDDIFENNQYHPLLDLFKGIVEDQRTLKMTLITTDSLKRKTNSNEKLRM